MSCIAVLITQHINSDLKAATQLYSMVYCQNIILTKIYRAMICLSLLLHRQVCNTSQAELRPFMLYSLDLNKLLSQLPLTAEVGGRYCSSSAVLSHEISPRTWLRSVMPQSLIAVSSSSRRTVTSSVDSYSSFSNATYYQHNAPLPLCRTLPNTGMVCQHRYPSRLAVRL